MPKIKAHKVNPITPRECLFLQYLSQGLSNLEIAEKMHYSVKSVACLYFQMTVFFDLYRPTREEMVKHAKIFLEKER